MAGLGGYRADVISGCGRQGFGKAARGEGRRPFAYGFRHFLADHAFGMVPGSVAGIVCP